VAIGILTSLSIEAGVSAFFSINQFVLFAFITTIIFSAVFELPLLVSWLAINGIVSIQTLKEKRKHVYVGVFILAAVITADPTIISQVLLAIPLIILYELSIISARVFGKSS
jgi:sec-independent protein translocase protein TatC